MSSTPEQLKCITTLQQPDCDFLSIEAVSGSGKTYLLTEISKALRPLNGLYIAYSKAIATEASKKFPSSITCSTTHSLAYQNTVRPFGLRVGFFGYRDIQVRMPFEKKILVVESLKDYCLSRFVSIDEYIKDRQLKYDIAEPLKKYLGLMKQGTIDSTHDFYLKYYHILLSNGSIKHDTFDLIMLDECLTGDSQIKIPNSIPISIKNIKDRFDNGIETIVTSFNEKTKVFEPKRVINAVCNGERNIFETKTHGSNILRSTDNHKVLTQRGYVEVKDLIPDHDYLVISNPENSRAKRILTSKQDQMIIGSILGDGNLIKRTTPHSYSMKLTQGEKQLDYLSWKLDAFGNDYKTSLRKTQSGYTKKWSIYQSKEIETFIINEPIFNYLSKMDARALAIWVMDDGSASNDAITIHSNSFSQDENILFQCILIDNFGLQPVLQKNRDYYELRFNKEEADKLRKIISPYMHSSFVDKFGTTELESMYDWTDDFESFGGNIVKSVTPCGSELVYDITVEDNHNFVTLRSRGTEAIDRSGIVVHNCGDLNEVTLEIFKLLPATKKVMVGDPFQNIFQFNKTINGFRAMADHGIHLPLSQSFRVDSNIAKLIQGFCREFMDPKMVFKGIDFTPEQRANIKTTAFISRTNGTLISEMIKLNQLNEPYGLTRPAKSIFELPLGLISLNKTGIIKLPQYKHLEEDYRDYHNNERLQEKSFYGYLSELHSDDISIKTALGAIMKHGPKSIIETFEKAKSHEGGNQSHTLCTSHSSKGLEWDSVYIADDIAEKIKKIIESKKFRNQGIEGLEPEEVGEMNLAYVSFSRAKYELLNAKAIYWTADMNFEEDEFNQQLHDYADTLF